MDILYSQDIYAGIDIKYFYSNRFSVCSGIDMNLKDYDLAFKVIALTYHINGFTPISWHLDNLEVELAALYNYNKNKIIPSLGLRENW